MGIINHGSDYVKDKRPPSILSGPTTPSLLDITLGNLLDIQADLHGFSPAIICPNYQSKSEAATRWSYSTLRQESLKLARGLQSLGVEPGERIGVLAGNCAEYVSLFFAAAYIGSILVVLNNTYTKSEARNALRHSGCRLLFTVNNIGRTDLGGLLRELGPKPHEKFAEENLLAVVMLKGARKGFLGYREVIRNGSGSDEEHFSRLRARVRPDDVCNLQYTSGSTGQPKAAMLTHFNLVNNAKSIGDRLAFTPSDVLCCPPPLFHCFGLVLGVLATLTHGSAIILPSETFHAPSVLQAISDENCTALHGVPTMFEELLSLPRPLGWSCSNLRTGIIAGAPVPRPLMRRLVGELGMTEFTSSYGLTETSPTCFNAYTFDSIDTRLNTVGRLLPHLRARIVDRNGNIVPLGERGELCIAGYSLQKGYWNNPEKTAEVMIKDDEGTLWLHTGDEASFTEDDCCQITGRFKDIIIRGGENIYPVEVEERLCAHPSIARAAVIGIRSQRYGEVVGAFLLRRNEKSRPSDEEIRAWTRQVLGRHKAPVHIFWFGEEGTPHELPQTGSGKMKKYALVDLAEKILRVRADTETGVERAML